MKIASIIISILLMGTTVFCINHMDLIQTMSGEFAGSEFGITMASIDFNADGYDDLVVSSNCWNPNGVYSEQQLFGKLYFYWGGPNFDNVPDMVLNGSHHGNYGIIYNAGDINGDGFDDLVSSGFDSLNAGTIELYYGSQNPQPTPDIILTYPLTLTHSVWAIPLGDINEDNHADLGLLFNENANRFYRRLLVLTDTTQPPLLFYETNNYQGFPLLSGIGDVNDDGLDDFFMHLPVWGGTNNNMRLVLYYGSQSFPVIDSLVISADTQGGTTDWGCPVGDVNGDGIDDFVAYNFHLWLGSQNLTTNWNIALNSQYGISESGLVYPIQHGDFNNDGFDDIVGSNSSYGYWYGVVNIWMGRSQMNGMEDLNLWNPSATEHCNFGKAKAVGDFNADGCDDIAVSAPWWIQNDHTEEGKVFVFAGNSQLADTTVGNEDENITPVTTGKWDINIYPNPVQNNLAKLKVQFIGSGYKTTPSIKLEIYNIKGQKLLSRSISNKEIIADAVELTVENYHQGCYFAVVKANKQVLATKKIYIITN